ncbi:heavy-metal-associated domain-containing protein [Tautonia sociabilis]|uniref:heavy-metal-associated domain-containing protein n=1 Tax=Tautonia sociabilis TaxID=2080755 RepID=UPI00131542B2|nr:copper ion binding protein [Tautonia sociabilis]
MAVVAVAIYAVAWGPFRGVRGVSTAGAEPLISDGRLEAVTIPVEGMSCGACAARIKKTLKSSAGVASVEVSLERRSVLVRYLPEKTSPERMAAEITELGYKATVPAPAEPGASEPVATPAVDASAADPKERTTAFPVRGMACESCVETVENLLRSMPGVKAARVSLEEKEAEVRYVEGEVTPERLAEEVTAQGFESGPPRAEGAK